MKTYFGIRDTEGAGRITVQSASGESSPLFDEQATWNWGTPHCTDVAWWLFHDALGVRPSMTLCNVFVKLKLSKLDAGSPFTIDWYEVKEFYDKYGEEDPNV